MSSLPTLLHPRSGCSVWRGGPPLAPLPTPSASSTLRHCCCRVPPSAHVSASVARLSDAVAASPHVVANRLLAAVCGSGANTAAPRRANAATVPGGYRGLVAASPLLPGDAVLEVPLASALIVSEHGSGGSGKRGRAAAGAIDAWQRAHRLQLPTQLAAFLTAAGVEWEARLAAWLLWLVAMRRRQRQQGPLLAGPVGDGRGGSGPEAGHPDSSRALPQPCGGQAEGNGSREGSSPEGLWDLYVDSLPGPDEMATFYDFTEDEAEAWLPLAAWRVSAQRLGRAEQLPSSRWGGGSLVGSHTVNSHRGRKQRPEQPLLQFLHPSTHSRSGPPTTGQRRRGCMPNTSLQAPGQTPQAAAAGTAAGPAAAHLWRR
jgi:hypothetical protein